MSDLLYDVQEKNIKEETNYNQDQNIDNIKNVDECIICFEKDSIEHPLKNIETSSTLISNCKCLFSFHEDCIDEWLRHKSLCVMCNEPFIRIPSIQEIDTRYILPSNITPLSTPLLPDLNNITTQHHNSPSSENNNVITNNISVTQQNSFVQGEVRQARPIIVEIDEPQISLDDYNRIRREIMHDSDEILPEVAPRNMVDRSVCKCYCSVLGAIIICIIVKNLL